MPIAIAVCDDEKVIREHIMHLINNQCGDFRVDLYDSGDSLLAASVKYDIYFMDIQMPGVNGMKVAQLLRERQNEGLRSESLIIFITALKEYMADAFDVKAFNYLVKPIDENKFKAVFSRAINDCRKIEESMEKYILIKTGYDHHKVFLKDIYYVESRDKKIIINSVGGVMEYYVRMQEIENTLGSAFFRCHRCYIVNMEHIIRYNANTIWVKDGGKIFLSQRKYPTFVKAYMAFASEGE